jgi:hypothetical protein
MSGIGPGCGIGALIGALIGGKAGIGGAPTRASIWAMAAAGIRVSVARTPAIASLAMVNAPSQFA